MMQRNGLRALALSTVAALVFLPGGMSGQAPHGTTPSTTPETPNAGPAGMSQTGPDASNDPQMQDRMFLRKASEGGMAEVQLGQLAAQKGGSNDVKQFGQKMVDDHTKLNEQMAPIAQSLGLKPPKHLNKMDQAEYDKLNGLSGDEFDKEYIAGMVKDHRKDVHEFKMEQASTSNPQLKDALGQAIPVIQQHLSMVTDMAKQKGIMVGGHGNSGQ